MSAVTFKEVQDAIERIELHQFNGTAVVACALICTDGQVIVAIGYPLPEEGLNISNIAARARASAEKQLAENLGKQKAEQSAELNGSPRG